MNIQDLQNKLVAVLGYGLEGKATLKYLMEHGVKPVLFDQKAWENWPEEEQEAIKALGINVIFGPDCLKELAGFEVAFRSPGLPVLNKDLQRFHEKGLIITSQAKWFFDRSAAPIVGVTGTKGKGTTSTLIAKMLKVQGEISGSKTQIYLTGNIGEVQPFEIVDKLKPEDYVVYELSSFQLQDLDKSPHIAVVLMVTSEHLDYHADVHEYRGAKGTITHFQTPEDFAIISNDYEGSLEIGQLGHGKKIFFSRKGEVEDGCFVRGGSVIYRDKKGYETEIIKRSELQLRGDHNLENVAAASLVGIVLGLPLGTIRRTLVSFTGLEHRLEYVGEKEGVKFYNDSFSTTPETAVAAIQSFHEPEILILGGSPKNSDFSELGKTVAESSNIKAIVYIGPESARIKEAVAAAGGFSGKVLEGAGGMEEIFSQVRSVMAPGDVVLLSPACASFGMFKNYKDRGKEFKRVFGQII